MIEPAHASDVPAVIALIGRVFAEYRFSWDPALEVPDLFDFDRPLRRAGAAPSGSRG